MFYLLMNATLLLSIHVISCLTLSLCFSVSVVFTCQPASCVHYCCHLWTLLCGPVIHRPPHHLLAGLHWCNQGVKERQDHEYLHFPPFPAADPLLLSVSLFFSL